MHEPFEVMQAELLAAQAKKTTRAPGRARVEKIISATTDLLRVHNPKDIGIAMVARHADITRTSIYAHFQSIEEIFQQISIRFTKNTGLFVESYVRDRKPTSLQEVLEFTIDGICKFFNGTDDIGDRDDDDDCMRHVPFAMHVVVEDFDKVSALTYHSLWKTNWPIEPLSEFDPFRVLVILQTAMFSASFERYGCITDAFAKEIKRVACDFILSANARLGGSGASPPSSQDRISAAIRKLSSGSGGRLLDVAAAQLESLAAVIDPG